MNGRFQSTIKVSSYWITIFKNNVIDIKCIALKIYYRLFVACTCTINSLSSYSTNICV